MSSPAPSNISQNNAKVLEMQQRHEEEQWLLVQLEKAAKSCWAECAAHKTKKKAERRRIAEEEKKKKRTLEYLQQLWDKVLEEDTTLLEGAEGSWIVGLERKEISLENDADCWPFKKAKGKQPVRY